MTAAEPTFEDTYLAVAEDVFDGSIGDLAAVEDPGGYVSDDAGDYLFGLSSDFRVLVVNCVQINRWLGTSRPNFTKIL